MRVRSMSVKEALLLLDLKPPKLKRGMTQADADRTLDAWKATALVDQLKSRRKEEHPDRHNNTDESQQRFSRLTLAFEAVKEHLRLRIPPAVVDKCRECGEVRKPVDARHCHDCGLAYLTDDPRVECPLCETARESGAKFCHSCGYDYQQPDALVERLLSMGFLRKDLDELEEDGTLGRWRKIPPFHPELKKVLEDELKHRQLKRKMAKLGVGNW